MGSAPPSLPLRWLRSLPAHVVNGVSVALGIGVLHAVFQALAGPHAAQLAMAGAVCASLADLPATVRRGWHRVLAAGLLGVLAAALVAWLQPHPAALGLGVVGIGFAATLALAWGPRAAPVSFAAVLALVFAMGVPAEAAPPPVRLGWNLLGALCYLPWSIASATLLQRHYGRLALASALTAAARLLRLRAGDIEAAPPGPGDTASMRDWTQGEASLAERLQAARDLLFPAALRADMQRDIAILLRLVDLRDLFLATRLDLDLLGNDAAGAAMRRGIAASLRHMASTLELAGLAVSSGKSMPADRLAALLQGDVLGASRLPAGDARLRLQPALTSRLQRLAAEVAEIDTLLSGGPPPALPLQHGELRAFVGPEGWPLAVLRQQLSLRAPALRHALRTGLALGCAYLAARALPWASHPWWVVLSVAVVLRGNLEQTLQRRNARVLGTLAGCALVLLLAPLASPLLLGLAFTVAVGLAHGFVNVRYAVTAAAGAVMALLQSHAADPAAGFAVAERMADTLLGAGLGWLFSYVLPSWERRSVPQAVERVVQALRSYAGLALAGDATAPLAQRLARRQAYDTLAALAAAVQRSEVEPRHVRLPTGELMALLDHGLRLMAHLSVIRLMLRHRSDDLRGEPATAALLQASDAVQAWLDLDAPPPDGGQPPPAHGLDQLPAEDLASAALPWLVRRLQVSVFDASQVAGAARAARQRLQAG